MSEARVDHLVPSAVDHLRSIINHHLWATQLLIDRCLELSPEQLQLSTPGTYGSIHATLDHLVQSDRGYQRRIMNEERMPQSAEPLPLPTLRDEMARQASRWRELLDRVDGLDATMPAEEWEDPPYPEIPHAVGLFLTQAVHHGEEHRTHVRSILGAHGLEVPELSGWEYFRLLERE